MIDALAVGRITYPPGERVIVALGTLPDPRDARIAELEAALREIENWCEIAIWPQFTLKAVQERAAGALMPPPEGDMVMAVEEWDA